MFAESGASWLWVLAGPAAALSLMGIQLSIGNGIQWVVPLAFLVMVSGLVGLQIKAARIHTSVELTRHWLRAGTETLLISEIVRVYPIPENTLRSGRDTEVWQSARSLGELAGVPRGRTGIGLTLTNRRTAQAWARRHRSLRAALTELVEEQV
ncbi:MAG: DUF3093 domain-containing protein [Mycobacterium sp.]